MLVYLGGEGEGEVRVPSEESLLSTRPDNAGAGAGAAAIDRTMSFVESSARGRGLAGAGAATACGDRN